MVLSSGIFCSCATVGKNMGLKLPLVLKRFAILHIVSPYNAN